MVKKARAFDMRAVLVVPPPIDAEKYFAWVSKNLNPKAILKYLGDVQHIYRWQERYALAVAEIGSKLNCTILNLRDAFLVRGISRAFCAWTASTPRRRATNSSGTRSAA